MKEEKGMCNSKQRGRISVNDRFACQVAANDTPCAFSCSSSLTYDCYLYMVATRLIHPYLLTLLRSYKGGRKCPLSCLFHAQPKFLINVNVVLSGRGKLFLVAIIPRRESFLFFFLTEDEEDEPRRATFRWDQGGRGD